MKVRELRPEAAANQPVTAAAADVAREPLAAPVEPPTAAAAGPARTRGTAIPGPQTETAGQEVRGMREEEPHHVIQKRGMNQTETRELAQETTEQAPPAMQNHRAGPPGTTEIPGTTGRTRAARMPEATGTVPAGASETPRETRDPQETGVFTWPYALFVVGNGAQRRIRLVVYDSGSKPTILRDWSAGSDTRR